MTASPASFWSKIDRIIAPEGNVEKHVFTKGTAVAEAVLYKYKSYANRTVICCSTQSGCPVGCRFCGAGDYFVRSLTTDEIVSQPALLLNQIEKETGTKAADIQNLQIMVMSMGEPLLNSKRLVEAFEELHILYPNARLLISTSAPDVSYDEVMDCAERIPTVGLQFSVHESTDEARDKLVPFKKKLTLAKIAVKGEEFFRRTGRRPFFNYCVHEDNDSQSDVDRLVALFDPRIWESTVSVICERDETMAAAQERQEELTTTFMDKMLRAGYSSRRFDPAGQDTIAGGCGMLAYVQDWFKENPALAKPSVGNGLPILHSAGAHKRTTPLMLPE